MTTRLGIDVGGTFTDLIVWDEETGTVVAAKAPTRPAAVDEGVQALVNEAVGPAEMDRARYFLHGTTVGLNAVLTRSGVRVAVLTTGGFRDVLEIRRMQRIDEDGERIWDVNFPPPVPLVPRELRVGVPERIGADGTIHRSLDHDSVRAAARLFSDAGVECVAVIFLNSHVNPRHELEAAEILREQGFEGLISLSHVLTGEYREYERTSTTVIDAYIRPVVASYLERLESSLSASGFRGQPLITTSSGGALAFTEASSRPFETVMSGPVAGAIGASVVCRELGLDLAVTADVGGTSFDTCLLLEGQPQVKYEGRIGGLPLQTPWVDVRSIGAGGGSIAYTEGGLLHVGPQSAGALPGPACYGRGGTVPTVTDAVALLGMFGDDQLASGLVLDRAAAAAALQALGDELDLDATEVAQGVIRIVNASMGGAIRAVTVEVGEDPRGGAIIAFGGAGPLFGCLLARELGVQTVVVPNFAGNFSAWGLLSQDVVRSAALTVVSPLDEAGLAHADETIRTLFERLDDRATSRVRGEVRRDAALDLRYEGQEHTLAVPVALDEEGRLAVDVDDVVPQFRAAYERTYGHSFDHAAQIVSVRASERTILSRPTVAALTAEASSAPPASRTVQAYSFAARDWRDFELLARDQMHPGFSFSGPAIVQELTATTYVDADFKGFVHPTRALVLTGNERKEA